MVHLTDIYDFNDEMNATNSFEKYFDKVSENLNQSELNINQKLVYKLLTSTDEVNFSETYDLLSSSGLELIDYINHILFDFTFKIEDDRVKFWIVYLYPDNKQIQFILWLLQYQFKNNSLIINDNKIYLIDIPNILFSDFEKSLYYYDENKKLKHLFNDKNRGISLL